ncbi:hypothetical protein [Nonomuraea sp. CA-141351]
MAAVTRLFTLGAFDRLKTSAGTYRRSVAHVAMGVRRGTAG